MYRSPQSAGVRGRERRMRKYVAGAPSSPWAPSRACWCRASAGAARGQAAGEQQFVVVYAKGASAQAAHAAIAAAGGTIVKENAKIGVATVRSTQRELRRRRRRRPRRSRAPRTTRSIGSAPDQGGADGEAQKFDPAQADLEAAVAARGPAATRAPSAGEARSRSPVCSGTCSRSAPPPPARSATSRARACASASSTRASTARTRTSRRTSTRR